MTDAANLATEVVAEVAEEVADQALTVADVSRGLSGRDMRLVFGGIVIGAAVGGTVGYFILRNRLEKKYEEIAEGEISTMREHYAAKIVAAEPKPDPSEIIAENGYTAPETSVSPPLAVTPPDAVVEAAAEAREAEEAPAEVTPVTIGQTPEQEQEVRASIRRNVFDENRSHFEWNYERERAARSPNRPYVIHFDERVDEGAYPEVTWTYYAEDDVLCNEKDEVIDKRDELIGEANLDRFGHGSGDDDIVYVRNNSLSMDIEIVKSDKAYVHEVLGIEHSDRRQPRRRDRSFRDNE